MDIENAVRAGPTDELDAAEIFDAENLRAATDTESHPAGLSRSRGIVHRVADLLGIRRDLHEVAVGWYIECRSGLNR